MQPVHESAGLSAQVGVEVAMVCACLLRGTLSVLSCLMHKFYIKQFYVYVQNCVIIMHLCSYFNYLLFPQVMDLKIFVETDSDIRLARRLKRDITERGRDLEGVLKQYNKFVKPAFEQFIEPSVKDADIVVPRGKKVVKYRSANKLCF